MNQEHLSDPQFRNDLHWSVLAVVFLLALPVIVVLVKFVWPRIRCRTQTQTVTRQHRTIRFMPSPATMLAFARESVWLGVPYVVALSFVITCGPFESRSRGLSAKVTTPASSPSSPVAPQGMILRVEPGSDARVEAHRDSNGIQTANITVSPSNAVPTSDASPHDTPAKAAPQRPAWVDQKRVIDGDCTRIVLTSQQYATKEEAEQELRVAAVKFEKFGEYLRVISVKCRSGVRRELQNSFDIGALSSHLQLRRRRNRKNSGDKAQQEKPDLLCS